MVMDLLGNAVVLIMCPYRGIVWEANTIHNPTITASISNAAMTPTHTPSQELVYGTVILEDTTEADLQELFQPFSRISRVHLAKDKETMISR
jgi:hypothetical protein